MQILKETFENGKEFRKEEMELKKKEQESKAAQHQMLIDQQNLSKFPFTQKDIEVMN